MHASTTDCQTDPIALPIAVQLAHLIHDFKQSQVTPKALKAARTTIIETIGVTLAGSAEPCTKILARDARGRRRAGRGNRVRHATQDIGTRCEFHQWHGVARAGL